MSPLLLVACHAPGLAPDGGPTGPTDPPPAGPAAPAVALEVAPAFDPLRGPVEIRVVTAPAAEVAVEVADGDEVVLSADGVADDAGRFAVGWDGRDGDRWRPATVYAVRATATRDGVAAEASATVAAVRPGFATARLEDDDGVSALREPIFFPLDAALQDESDPVAALDAIDDGAVPLDLPAVAPGPMAARPDDAEPAAFVFDSRPLLVLEPGPSDAMDATGLHLAPIEVAAAGWTVLAGSPLAEDVPVVLQRDLPLGDTIGVTDEVVTLAFSTGGAPLGEQRVPLRIYRVLDVSGFEDPSPGYRPWGPVLEEALVALDGTPAEHGEVTAALVEWIYRDLGLTYDTAFGASAYSEYRFFVWDRPHFRLSDFLVRRFGSVINCSDAANILGAYANMVGARLDHLVLDPNFGLNYIQAIGGTEFTSCPFGMGVACSFSYHAVTTAPDSLAIWDATLALDGDDDPGALPATELLVQAIPAAEYMDRLVRSGAPTFHDQAQETLE